MKVDAFKKFLNLSENKNLILVNGSEDYFKLAVKDYIIKKYKNAEIFSYTSDEITYDKMLNIVSEANTIPFLSDTKIFFLRDIDHLNKKTLEVLSSSLDNISQGVKFILTSEKIDGRSALYKKITKNGVALKASTLYDNECAQWVDYFLKPLKKNITGDAKSLFIDLIGSSLNVIQKELEKLSLFIKDKPRIEYEDVVSITNSVKMSSVFSLTDAIGKSDRINSLALLKNMCDQGTNEILILTMIARHFKILLKIKAYKNKSRSEIASSLKINPYFINNYMDQASQISFERLLKFYKKVCDTDFFLKSTRSSSYQVIENLILTN